jgi:thiamine-monophosphate kinase
LVSFCIPKDTEVELVEDLYKGLYSSAKKHKVKIIGGDSTHGKNVVITVTVVGEVEKNRLCLRSNARVGEKILVTGDLGKSAAGLELLLQGKKGFLKDHLEPKARVKEAREISKYSKCMIDVSDGLASEVKHICEMSGTGAVVWKEKIPLSKTTIQNAELAGKDPFDLALNGGEDFELVFTLPENKISKLKNVEFSVVGEILPKNQGIYLLSNGKKLPLGSGFNHFK